MAGIECLRALNDAGIVTERPIEVAVWMNEEGSRFAPGAMGSSAFVDPRRLASYLDVTDAAGESVRHALKAFRQRFPHLPPRPDDGIAAFIELHIEQGPVLEQAGLPLAVVEGIQGVRWYQVTCRGESAHAGTTPMAGRRDAMRLARTVADRIESALADVPADELRLTFGRWEVLPNAINTVAAGVSFTVDFRHPDPAVLACLDRLMEQIINDDVQVAALLNQPPVAFDGMLSRLLMDSSGALDIPFTTLRSGAFHDAMHLAGYCPSSMLFVPSHKGISHNPSEYTDPRSLRLGAQVLACALTELACLSEGDVI
ncbi:hydantoinase/carbamoylase family amidase [Acerihabitans sp. KWT182]|uniref:Hydantoinase/carbamoylase family amidase n=1 Tax=Acerihabitans sp. KWT182 TaxID=3157919 RepID=A0AAU7QFD1_9GAMM